MEKERDCQERQEGGGRHVRVNGEEQKKEEKQSYCRADFTVEQQTYSDEQPVCVHFVAVVLGVLSGLCVIFCGSVVLSAALAPEHCVPTREVHQIRLVHSTLSFSPSHLLLRQSKVSSVRFSGSASFTLSVFAGNSWQRPVPRIAASRHHCKNLEKDT